MLVLWTGLIPWVSLLAGEPDGPTEEQRFFVERVEPLLRAHCYSCHSHAAGEISGGLTLDSRSGWATGGQSGPAIIPHKPTESLLIQAIRRENADLQMPPEEELPAEKIELLVEWIERGATDPRATVPSHAGKGDPGDWWSLRALNRPLVPQPTTMPAGESRQAIDAFVLHELEANGLQPAPLADRRTLIRRLYFDLHGLPPTTAEADAFVADPDPLAYERLVDRLLDSPRYGERWARHWLDAVHFADSHGCEHDVLRPHAWRYRDYVIASLNGDTAWPRFIREQLAADHFFPAQTNLTAALGFISAGPLELSRAGTAPVTFDYLDRDDIVTQTMASLASTTANCARCHDHKFDPITQEDYYSLQAVFAGVGKGDVEFDADPEVAVRRGRYRQMLQDARNKDSSIFADASLVAIADQWEAEFAGDHSNWQTLVPTTFLSSGGATLQRLDDNSLIANDHRPDQDTYTITAPTSLNKLSALRLDVLADETLPLGGPGRQDNGNLHLTEFEAYVFDPHQPTPTRLTFRKAVADWDQDGWTIEHALDQDLKTAWGIYPKVGQSHHAVFDLEQPIKLNSDSQVVVVLKQLHGHGHLIGRLKIYATDVDGATARVVPENVAAALGISRKHRTPEQQNVINAYAIESYAQQQLAKLPEPATVYAVSSHHSHGKALDKPAPPKVVHVLQRGDIEEPGKVAVPGALSVIKGLEDRFDLQEPQKEASRRAALADWLASPENPLTFRSVVNRVWHHHFGRGICDTPNDFGRMGGKPSHPELLDWLAVWFRDDANGSLKKLHRKILLSKTYQRRSQWVVSPSSRQGTAEPTRIDPENRLLWRMNRRRLDAESYRDAVLQISGRIDLTMGGPGIEQFTKSKGAQSTPALDYDAFDWNAAKGARRSIYRVVWRGIADPFMESLDFPDLGLLAPRRGISASPLQSLVMFNNDFVLHHSQVLAESLKSDDATIDRQVAAACRLIFLREPYDDERRELVDYTNKHGLAALCRVLLNSNEFVFID